MRPSGSRNSGTTWRSCRRSRCSAPITWTTSTPAAYTGPLECVCKVHTHLIPARDYERLQPGGDRGEPARCSTSRSRRCCSRSRRATGRSTAMPEGQATLLWLKRNMPRTAEKVLAEVRARCSSVLFRLGAAGARRPGARLLLLRRRSRLADRVVLREAQLAVAVAVRPVEAQRREWIACRLRLRNEPVAVDSRGAGTLLRARKRWSGACRRRSRWRSPRETAPGTATFLRSPYPRRPRQWRGPGKGGSGYEFMGRRKQTSAVCVPTEHLVTQLDRRPAAGAR